MKEGKNKSTSGTKEVKALASGIHISPRKMRLAANLVKHLPVAEALVQLDFLTKKAATPIKKLINSGIANAKHNFQIEAERLFIKKLTVDGGRVFFRYQPRAQGRALPVRKRTSHISLVLGVSQEPVKPKRKFLFPAKKQKKEELKPVEASVPEIKKEEPRKKRGFWFWPRKKQQDSSQLPPKEDPKSKPYTSFDRRGNM